MGKIAVALAEVLAQRARDDLPGRAAGRLLASGDGWAVQDVLCSSGPQDRPFEELHQEVSVAVVAAGTFQYRTARGHDLMTPGSLLLGNPGEYFECGHEHGQGDRCFAFRFNPDFFNQVAADAGMGRPERRFRGPRIPPLRRLSPLLARISAGVVDAAKVSWEELSVTLAATAAMLSAGSTQQSGPLPAGAFARVTEAVRTIDHEPSARLSLSRLAAQARLSPYHFLRTFERLTGVTPHQFILRARLREAALRLLKDRVRVIDVAFESGFGDLSNFNQAFRAEFGLNPRAYRSSSGVR